MTVDGHTFRVTRCLGVHSRYDLDRLTGPDQGYGFTASSYGGEAMSRADRDESVRSFLTQVEPVTRLHRAAGSGGRAPPERRSLRRFRLSGPTRTMQETRNS